MILNKEDLKTEELNLKLQNSNNYKLSSYFFAETIRQFFLWKNFKIIVK